MIGSCLGYIDGQRQAPTGCSINVLGEALRNRSQMLLSRHASTLSSLFQSICFCTKLTGHRYFI